MLLCPTGCRNVLFVVMRKRFRRPKALQDCCHQDGAFRLAEGDFERSSSVYSRCCGCWPALCLPDIDLVLVFIHGATFPRSVCSCFSSIASSILYSSEHADRRWLVYLPRRCRLISAKSLEHKLSSCFDETVACGRAFAPRDISSARCAMGEFVKGLSVLRRKKGPKGETYVPFGL